MSIFLIAAAMTCLFLINFCNWIHRCGCRSLWAGADRYCNIHTPGVKHCPWCEAGPAGFAVIILSILIPQLIISFAPVPWSLMRRLVVALAAFPFFATLVALIYGGMTGYWSEP